MLTSYHAPNAGSVAPGDLDGSGGAKGEGAGGEGGPRPAEHLLPADRAPGLVGVFPVITGSGRGISGSGGASPARFGTEASPTAFPETVAVARVVQAMADEVAVVPATADPETTDPDTTDLAMAVPAPPESETDPLDLSAEQAFFADATVLSDHPVSFDTESRWPTLDLEGRELRRARFTRVVGAIVGTLGVGALLAVTRPGPRPMEAAPVAASPLVSTEGAELAPAEPTPTVLPELSVSAPDGSSGSVEPAPSSVTAPAQAAPAASAARSRKRTPRAPAATPVVPAASDNRPPPTAHFAD